MTNSFPQFSFKYGNEQFNSEMNGQISATVSKCDFEEFNAVYWYLNFENNSDKNSLQFSEIWDSDILLSLKGGPRRHISFSPADDDTFVASFGGMVDFSDYMHDDVVSATEFVPHRYYLNDKLEFANRGGRSSDITTPFFKVEAGNKGAIVAIGWTGDWRAEFYYENGSVRMRTGLKFADFYLEPGEKLRTSSVLIMEYDKSEDYINKFRRLIKNHFSHKSDMETGKINDSISDGILAYELWGGLPSEDMIKRIKAKKNAGVEYEHCWIDAGWYGNCTDCLESFTGDWAQHTGEWIVNKRVHPNEMLDVKEALNKEHIMLWLEPERAINTTPVAKEHPEWLLVHPDKSNANCIVNYGNEEAFNYIVNTVSDYIKKFDMRCFREDFNVELTEYFEKNDAPSRRGITEIKHILGVYRFWDTLRERFPDLIIDNCSSGGRRIDIETLKRTFIFFRSDYQCMFDANPEVIQIYNTNASTLLPYQGCTTKVVNDWYNARSCYASGFGGAFSSTHNLIMTESQLAWEKAVLDEYKSIRRYYSKDFYNHGSNVYDTTSWTVWQYHDPETDSGIILAFRRSDSPFSQMEITPKGIDGTYIAENADTKEEFKFDKNITLNIGTKRTSCLIRYRKGE